MDQERGPGPDFSSCEREPIHIPGSIQPHGVLIVLEPRDLTVLQASANTAELLGVPAAELVGRALGRALGGLLAPDAAQRLAAGLSEREAPQASRFLGSVAAGESRAARRFDAVAHRTAGGVVLELELAAPAELRPEPDPRLEDFTLRAEVAATLAELSRETAAEVRRLTGFDRVLIYQFDPEWNGTVIGEDGSGRLPSYLNHRFPAADIPAQARELYRRNRLRIIPDARYRPVPVVPPLSPLTGGPLDMSLSTLRSVSPVHLEYMRNMETAASMSVSILRGGQLWGLISCHHQEPKTVPLPIRRACDLVGRVFSLRSAALEHTQDYVRRIEVQSAYARLLTVMSGRKDFAAALAEHPQDLLSFLGATGAAILSEGGCLLLGDAPTQEQVLELADWLFAVIREEVYSTDSLPSHYPPAHAYKDRASGLVAVAVSQLHPSYVLWFRPEVIQTIKWGGNPSKPVEPAADRAALHPRRSFETWKETVRDRAAAWKRSEIEGAGELRNNIVGTVLRNAEELLALNAELARSNKELEAFSYSVSHDLRAPLRHIAGYAEMLRESGAGKFSARDERYLNTIIESSEYAGRLVDKLLQFSRLGRAGLQRARVDMNALVREIQQAVLRDAEDRTITWKVAELPTVVVDLMMLRMAVGDLLANAVKYTRQREEALIEIGYKEEESEYVFFVKDNGVGFDMAYVDKLFGVFQRLHRWEEYEGTGIGLANVRRVVERHGGRTWAQGEEGRGATFYFTLPKSAAE